MGHSLDFSIKKRRHKSELTYKKESLDLAYMFTKECHKECKDLVKGIVLFGSTARKKQGANDVDVLVLIDDVSLQLTPELIQTYRVIIGKLVRKISMRLHVTTLKLSAFWEYVRVGDPIAINILRDGFALFDTGFFDPLQLMLLQGRIRPSVESVEVHVQRAHEMLETSRGHLLGAAVDLYWAVIDSAHAALMSLGHVPASPEHVSEMIEDKLVKKHLAPKFATNRMRKFYTLSKEVATRKRPFVSGEEYEELYKQAREFIVAMEKIVRRV